MQKRGVSDELNRVAKAVVATHQHAFAGDIELRFLLEVADGDVLTGPGFAGEFLVERADPGEPGRDRVSLGRDVVAVQRVADLEPQRVARSEAARRGAAFDDGESSASTDSPSGLASRRPQPWSVKKAERRQS